MVSLEEIMDNQRCPVEQDARHIVRVLRKFITSKDTVEDQPRIGESSSLDGQWLDTARVRGVCFHSQFGVVVKPTV